MSEPIAAPGHGSRGRRGPAATLANLSDALEGSLFAEGIARQPGLLQALDPRAKLVGALLLLLAISLSRSLAVIAGLYLVTLALAWRSAVPLRFFVRRVWLLLPFFTGVIALPALFTVPGPALVHLPLGLVITRTGLAAAAFLILRVGASVSTAVLLVLTTPWNSLLKALGVLRVPDVIVVILGMTYRYIYLLLHLAGDMFRARQSRTVGRLGAAEERRLLAASTGVLLSRSVQLSGEVYLAMQARGLRGYPRTMDTFRLRSRDWVALAVVVGVVGVAVWLGR